MRADSTPSGEVRDPGSGYHGGGGGTGRLTQGPVPPPLSSPSSARGLLGEKTDAAGAYQEPDDDEHDPEQDLPSEELDDAADHQDDGQDPQQECHVQVPPSRSIRRDVPAAEGVQS